MIQALIFDLDGTLVDTEPLKNLAYARVALDLSPDGLRAEEVMSLAAQFIGMTLPQAAAGLVQRLGLEEPARGRMGEMGATAPWQVFASLHTAAYNQLLDEPGVLQGAQLPHAVSLLYCVRQRGFRTGLATMSYRAQVQHVLEALSWANLFDAVATADDVARGKPDPEVYLRVAQALRVRPEACLVIEDSPSGVAGALAARMGCIAVPTDLTRAAVHRMQLDKRRIVDDASRLRVIVEQRLNITDHSPGLGS